MRFVIVLVTLPDQSNISHRGKLAPKATETLKAHSRKQIHSRQIRCGHCASCRYAVRLCTPVCTDGDHTTRSSIALLSRSVMAPNYCRNCADMLPVEFLLPPSVIVLRLAQANRFNLAMATARSLKVDMTDLFSHLTGQCMLLSRNPDAVMQVYNLFYPLHTLTRPLFALDKRIHLIGCSLTRYHRGKELLLIEGGDIYGNPYSNMTMLKRISNIRRRH